LLKNSAAFVSQSSSATIGASIGDPLISETGRAHPLTDFAESTADSVHPLEIMLPLREVMKVTSFSKATIYRKVDDGTFPAPRKISRKRVAWLSSDVRRWQSEQIAA
jgi:prophage regulatory protein